MPSSRSRRARSNLNRRSSATTFANTQREQPDSPVAAAGSKPHAHRAYSASAFHHDENDHLFPPGTEYDDVGRPGLVRPSSGRRLTYSSLPSTPIISSPSDIPVTSRLHYATTTPPIPPQEPAAQDKPLFSLWDYLREELLATDFESHQELKWDRVSNFLSIPLAMEKVC